MRREMADWVRYRRDAALVSDLLSTTAAKALRLSIIMPKSHANVEYYAFEAARLSSLDLSRLKKGSVIMPLVRIDISNSASRERVRDVGNAVYNAMIAVASVPEADRFQV